MKMWKKTVVSIITAVLFLTTAAGSVFAEEVRHASLNAVLKPFEAEAVSVEAEALPDNDELLTDYLEQELEIVSSPAMNGVIQAGKKLTGINYKIYSALKAEIEKIAAGERTSTLITISLKQLGLDGKRYTAKDLGVKELFVNGKVPQSTWNKAYELAFGSFSLSMIQDSLLVDCPADLYWYDKTEGCSYSTPGATATGEDGGYIKFTGDVQFYFVVSSDYAAGKYTVDSEKTEAVQAAIQNAKQIVEESAALGDYDKLSFYRERISDLTSYNKQAAAGEVPYGNPWQLIYVFDGDPDTKVVCEGYSKAFQYLCEMSSFQSRRVQSRIVSGKMSGGTGAGGHMWNVVTMNDGKNYVADLTNCDSGSVGYPDKLFLKGLRDGESMTAANQQYTVYAGGTGVRYVHDEDTCSIYETEKLLVATGNYDPAYIPEEGEEDPPEPEKLANPMTVKLKLKTVPVKYALLKTGNRTISKTKVFSISNSQGKVTFSKKSGNSKISISSTGKITVKKGLKKNTYKLIVTVKASGNDTYKPVTKKVALYIKVK